MFPTISKSKYVVFVKCSGLTENPTPTVFEEFESLENTSGLKTKPEKSTDKTKRLESSNTTVVKADLPTDTASIYFAGCILLEDQIVENLKLKEFGIFNLRVKATKSLLKGLFPITLSSKSAAVKSGFIYYYNYIIILLYYYYNYIIIVII